jgi:hypothetical protein
MPRPHCRRPNFWQYLFAIINIFLETAFGDDEWMKSDEKIASLNNVASSTLAGSIR